MKNYATRYIGQIIEVIIDRPMGKKHPRFNYIYPVNYGYIPKTVAPDGEGVDVYVLGVETPVETFRGTCVAVIHRNDDVDDKCVVAPDGIELSDEEIMAQVHFQEKYFDSFVVRDKQFQISQKAFIKKDEQYLILLRSDKHPVFADHWDLPGGRLDEGETLEAGLKREVLEETSLEVEIGEKIFEYDMVVVDRPTKFYIYDVKHYLGDVKLSKDHTEYTWATKEEILKLQTFPYISPFLEEI